MNNRHALVRRYTVYHGRGEPLSETCELPIPTDDDGPRGEGLAERTCLRRIMSNDLVCGRGTLSLGAVVDLMLSHKIGCLPIVDERRRPIGVITKSDLVEQLGAAIELHRGDMAVPLRARLAEDIMMPLALTLPETATIAHAAAFMASEDTHHVLVVSAEGRLVGVVSTLDITQWLARTERGARTSPIVQELTS